MGPADRPVDMVFSHANGFNARTYLSLLEPLATSRRIVAIDMRGHGRTTLPTRPEGRESWLDLRDDLIEVLAALDVRDGVLAGHSMGATVTLLAAAELGARVRSLVLFEPVIMPPGANGVPADAPLAASTLRRRAVFPDRETAREAYEGRGAFKTWSGRMLSDYLTDGLSDLPDGEVRLAADPAWEHSNYVSQSHDVRAALARVEACVSIYRAENGSTCMLSEGDLAALPGKVRLQTVPGTTHFLPMERADLFAQALQDA